MGHGMRRRPSTTTIVILFAVLCFAVIQFCSDYAIGYGWARSKKHRKFGRHAQQSMLAPVNEARGYKAIRNETLGFSDVYCISLPSREDKRDAMALVTSATDIRISFWDATRGVDIEDKALPINWDRKSYSDEALGCLRSHMNVLRDIVMKRHRSALIIEDDTSWDVSIKEQLIAFAKGARYVTQTPDSKSQESPYGNKWDLLWLGHCGSKPYQDKAKAFVMEDGPSVPGPHRRVKYGDSPDMGDYSKNARIVYSAGGGTCTYAYAVSYRGAQKFLRHLAAAKGPIDWELGEICSTEDFTCIAPYPALISEYKSVGSKVKDSDIEKLGSEFREKGYSINLVFDARLNLDKLLDDDTDYESQWPEDLS